LERSVDVCVSETVSGTSMIGTDTVEGDGTERITGSVFTVFTVFTLSIILPLISLTGDGDKDIDVSGGGQGQGQGQSGGGQRQSITGTLSDRMEFGTVSTVSTVSTGIGVALSGTRTESGTGTGTESGTETRTGSGTDTTGRDTTDVDSTGVDTTGTFSFTSLPFFEAEKSTPILVFARRICLG